MFDQKFLLRFFNSYKAWFVILSMIFYLFCLYEYKAFIFEYYGYMGFDFDFNLVKSLLAFAFYTGAYFYLFINNSEFIRAFSALFHVVFLLPILVIYQFMEMDINFVICSILLLVLINYKGPKTILPIPFRFKEKQKSILIAISVVVGVIPFFLEYKINFEPSFFLMGEDLYSVRDSLKDSGNFYTNYMLSPLSQVLLPVAAIYGLREKNFVLLFLSVGLTIVLFLMIPQKSIFFGIFVMLFFYFFRSPLKKIIVFTFLLFSILVVGKILFFASENYMIESLFLRRYLLLPSFLNVEYFDFFANRPIYFSHSFLKNFIDYPFAVGPSFLIGEAAFNNINTNANNGYLSDGFMNLGYIGMYIFTVLVGFLIKLFDSFNIDPKYFGLFFLLINLLRSSALSTTFLTHGVWLLILVGYLLLYQHKKKVELYS